MERAELANALRLHAAAYQLLLWLDKQASRDPSVFSAQAMADLGEGRRCRDWLRTHRDVLPAELLPAEDDLERFAHLLASFFATSFCVQRQEFDGKVLEARLHRNRSSPRIRGPAPHSIMLYALKRLATEGRMPLDRRTASRLVKRLDLREDLLIWSYGVELVRRAAGKSKGTAVHNIWLAMEPAVRRNLTADMVWNARERLLSAVRDVGKDGMMP